MTGEMRRVHSHPEVLLANGSQSGLECAGLAREKHAEICFAEWCPVYRRKQREADPIGRERQTS
jgi:hypothetical protein